MEAETILYQVGLLGSLVVQLWIKILGSTNAKGACNLIKFIQGGRWGAVGLKRQVYGYLQMKYHAAECTEQNEPKLPSVLIEK